MHSNKEANFEKVKVILLDVAGTTTSLEFVKEKLFGYVNEEVAGFLKKNAEDEAVKKALEGIKEDDKELDTEAAVELIKKLTKENSENASLKTLQGLIAKEGYENGTLKAHVFEDVRSAFEAWSADKKIAIYSTGDKESQKLLFEHTSEGTLTSHISYYFDQSTGSKSEPESYTKILDELKVSSDEVLFINDNAEELMAAKKSGFLTALVKREGNVAVDEETSKEFTITISSFADLSFENSNKRKLDDATDGTAEVPPPKVPKTDEVNTTEPETKPEEPEKIVESTESVAVKDDEKEKPQETSEAEPMEVDGAEKVAEEEKPVEVTSMETEESKPSETEPQKTDVEEKPTNLEENETKVDVAEQKSIETETKTEITDKVDSSNDNEIAAPTKMDEDAKEEKVELADKKDTTEVVDKTDSAEVVDKTDSAEVVDKTDSVEVVAEKDKVEVVAEKDNVEVIPEKDNVDEATAKKESIVVETKAVVADSEVDGSIESKTETSNAEVTTNTTADDKPCLDQKTPEETNNSNNLQSDSNQEDLSNKSEEPSAKESVEVKENNDSVVEKPLDKIVNEKVEETNKDDTNNSDNTNVIGSGDDTKTVVEEKNGISENLENGSTDEDKNEIKPSEDVTNGVANGQENGDKNSDAKEAGEETEIKVKVIETNEESPTVAVEV